MGFIKHALIGIALYEVVKCVLKKGDDNFEPAHNQGEGGALVHRLHREKVDVIAGVRQIEHLDRMKENATSGASDSGTPLTGTASDKKDLWKNSLANDELRAPDS